jgi:hypothetical protein
LMERGSIVLVFADLIQIPFPLVIYNPRRKHSASTAKSLGSVLFSRDF